ncbi:MAG: tyrosine-protein phosphatase, partial [Clostridiales bacterium]|nr:tyrosine-protein phosphatase [Clostridiales bacterium]
MSTYNPDNQLIKELALINCRELGGMPLAGGKTFRPGLFIRCGSPEWLTPEQVKEVKDYGVKAVIDLRAPEEIEQTGNPYKNDPDVKFYNIPLFNGNPNDTKDATMDFIRTHTL